MNKPLTTEEIEAVMEQALKDAQRDGQSTIKVKDGRFFLFSRAHLVKMLEALPEDKKELVIYVQERTLN